MRPAYRTTVGWRRHSRQRGVAIITALLIVTIAAAVSITISTKLQLDVRRTANIIALDQLDINIVQVNEFAKIQLSDETFFNEVVEQINLNGIVDYPFQVEQAAFNLQLSDMQSCINVNTLLDDNAVNQVTEARLRQVFIINELNPNLTQAITDWMDAGLNDQTTTPDGAEDGYYLNLEKPYRTANQPLRSISELRLVKGFEEPEVYNQVKNALCAYPAPADLAINVNTASKQVLMALSPNMNASLADSIIEQRKENPFNNRQEFTSFSTVNTIIPSTTPQISTESEYFLLKIEATLGPAKKTSYSILHRDNQGNTSIITRSHRTL